MSAPLPDPAFPPTQRIGVFVFEGLRADRRLRLRRGIHHLSLSWQELRGPAAVCTENFIRVDDVMESPKLAE
jgi:hypothetical protein